jgi:hypothetical protein
MEHPMSLEAALLVLLSVGSLALLWRHVVERFFARDCRAMLEAVDLEIEFYGITHPAHPFVRLRCWLLQLMVGERPSDARFKRPYAPSFYELCKKQATTFMLSSDEIVVIEADGTYEAVVWAQLELELALQNRWHLLKPTAPCYLLATLLLGALAWLGCHELKRRDLRAYRRDRGMLRAVHLYWFR